MILTTKQHLDFLKQSECIHNEVAFISKYSQPMFPLSCVHVRAHTGRETSAHKKTRSAQQNFLSNSFWHIFYALHPIYRQVLVNVAQQKLYAHTDFRKIEGTLLTAAEEKIHILNKISMLFR